MEHYLNTGIKSVIEQFPAVAAILNEFNIGCVPCAVGTCLLKDIVSIHNLSPHDEAELMYRIEKAIYPQRDVVMRVITEKKQKTAQPLTYSPPLAELVKEHDLIKRVLAVVSVFADQIDLGIPSQRDLLDVSADFIRSFADRFHHAKEEDILFHYFSTTDPVIQVILQDHVAGRSHVQQIVEAGKTKNTTQAVAHMKGYHDLLIDHIRREDTILYPWMDRNLSMNQIGELYSRFAEVNNANSFIVQRYETVVASLEVHFRK
ncbi:MAG: hemerythrin domain-containing protein [Spirochaetes bacterium]|nr:hemerythrin domain-containing protein [Spirochaetota bacterium]